MPLVKKDPRYVTVAYELCCGFERATALADDLHRILKSDAGFHSAKDDTRGWDGDRLAVVLVCYVTLEDANRLDHEVRRLLSRNVEYTYKPQVHQTYGSRGPHSYVTSTTALQERP